MGDGGDGGDGERGEGMGTGGTSSGGEGGREGTGIVGGGVDERAGGGAMGAGRKRVEMAAERRRQAYASILRAIRRWQFTVRIREVLLQLRAARANVFLQLSAPDQTGSILGTGTAATGAGVGCGRAR